MPQSRKSPAKLDATRSQHRRLVTQIGLQVRQMGAQSVVISQIIASRFGLHTTDLECLDVISIHKQVTAGRLAAATALTSGATTALIDRLVRAGYVERIPDPQDRRRVQVRIKSAAIKPIAAVYAPMQRQMFALWSSYSTGDLEIIADFLSRSRELAIQSANDIQHRARPSPTKRRRPRKQHRNP
jgi:DNA-binding MarR family transcriptional regulator